MRRKRKPAKTKPYSKLREEIRRDPVRARRVQQHIARFIDEEIE